MRVFVSLFALWCSAAQLGYSQRASSVSDSPRSRWIILLEDPPLAEVAERGADLSSPKVQATRAAVEARQQSILSELRRCGIPVTARTQILLNAIFVHTGEEEAARLAQLPGVAGVERLYPIRRQLNRASDIVRVAQAWDVLGGSQGAGAGVRIAILDTGIDHTHPAFQDDSLPLPPGFPKCLERLGECAFTNRKIIAARSYVEMLVLGGQPEVSRPDDLSPRDRVGHGTAAAMIAAGGRITGPAGTITGMAPKAYLGNYKIFGSPGVNDVTFEDVVIRALEDALNDGMHIASLSLGAPALWGPGDRGAVCGKPSSRPCDWRVDAVENATRLGMLVVVAAGNDADLGLKYPALNTIHTPGVAPSALTVGASTNAHVLVQTVRVAGEQEVDALFGNGPRPDDPLAGPLRDVSRLAADGLACDPLPPGSLDGAIALIARGECGRDVKVRHAQRAGAVAVVLEQFKDVDVLFPMRGLENTGIPTVLIGYSDGQRLRALLRQRGQVLVTLDPALRELRARDANRIAYFSSLGPSVGDSLIKPELVAPGTDLYVATQRFDPQGDMYHSSGFVVAQGTSFAAPMAAGVAALVKQRHPGMTPQQLKSAVVNTASEEVDDLDNAGRLERARVIAAGAGKLNAEAAVRTSLTVQPAAISFGVLPPTGALPSRSITVRNHGGSPVSLRLTVAPRNAASRLLLRLGATAVPAGGTLDITLTPEVRPAPGIYEGILRIEGGATALRVPYLFLVSDGIPYNIVPLAGYDFIRDQGGRLTLTAKVTDRYGVPVAGARVRFRSTLGGGVIDSAMERTDELGIVEARAYVGQQLGPAEFSVSVDNSDLTYYFSGRVRLRPSIQTGGVVNAGSLRAGQGLAPGSLIVVKGRGLSEATLQTRTLSFPLSLAGVSVSFDIPNKNMSLPGRLHYVSESQINLQIPWELQGANSALIKVSIGDSSSDLYTLPLLDYAPALYEYPDLVNGALISFAQHGNGTLITTANGARRGEAAVLYANGLGPVEYTPPSGEPTPAQPLSRTRVLPQVTIAGQPAEVSFAGLTPETVGLYQINVRIPAGVSPGLQPVVITIGGISSKTAMLPIGE